MLRVKMSDGAIFEGESWEKIIDEMRLSMRLGPDRDIETYMAGVKRRAKEWNGSDIRINDYEAFMRDLDSSGLIEILEGDK